MSPEEIELLVLRAIDEGLAFPWWLYLSVLFLTFVGGFLGAYLKRKGENFATKEDFDSLLNQVKETTIATESIKVDLAKGSWLHQQSWHLKEKYYSGLLEELYKLRESLSARLDCYMEPGSEHHDAEINNTDHYKRQARVGLNSIQRVRELYGPAGMVISSQSVKALDNFNNANWHAGNFSACSKDYLDDVYSSVDETYRVILAQARLELNSP